MNKILIAVLFSIISFSNLFAEEQLTVKTFPPVVVKTFPIAGSTTISPSIKEIKVTFSKDMMTDSVLPQTELEFSLKHVS